jgi:hypothetical protein
MCIVTELRKHAASGDSCREISELLSSAADVIVSLRQQVRESDEDLHDAAAEARWNARAEAEGVPYGTY